MPVKLAREFAGTEFDRLPPPTTNRSCVIWPVATGSKSIEMEQVPLTGSGTVAEQVVPVIRKTFAVWPPGEIWLMMGVGTIPVFVTTIVCDGDEALIVVSGKLSE